MRWLYKVSLAVIILFLSCIGSFALNFISTQLGLRNNFCSTNSVVYRAIKQKRADEWYAQASIQDIEVLKTETRIYYAEAYKLNDTPNLVYISVGTELDGLSGSEGFFYLLPDQSIPQYWFDNYWITHLDDNVYCYKIRGF